MTIPIAFCPHPPHIDGRVDDPCWKSATQVTGFYRFAGTAPIAQGNQTEAWVCADKTHLYIAFHCISQNPVRASESARNGDFSHDDFVGIDIDSQGTHRAFSSFLVNARGTQNEVLEGGTAGNITWAGDWVASAHLCRDGYTVEMAIPFALMRYPRGASSFEFLLYRQVAGELSLEGWPYVPLPDANNQNEALCMANGTALSLGSYSPPPTYLPYILASAGVGSTLKAGIDIKYPLSTTLTGLATVNPDFESIEQDVASINFSYTPKLLTDQRPFFAEGSTFLPDNDLFYSRQIGQIDSGLKVVGKQEDTTIGLLAIDGQEAGLQGAVALNLRQDLGSLSDVGFEFVGDNTDGLPNNRVGRLFGGFGFKNDGQTYTLNAFHTESYEGDRQMDGDDSIAFSNTQGQIGSPYFNLQWLDIGPDFVSNLGYVPEIDKRGEALTLGQTNIYAAGPWALSNIELDADDYQHHTEGFFHSDASLNLYGQTNSGWSVTATPAVGQHEQYHDGTMSLALGWGKKTLFQQGAISESFGHEAGERYNFLQIQQGLLVSRPFTVQLQYSQLLLGDAVTTQAIATGSYRITSEQTVGGRIVQQDNDTDIYLSFGRQVRSGTDVFVLFGDPNSTRTRGQVAVKLIRPF